MDYITNLDGINEDGRDELAQAYIDTMHLILKKIAENGAGFALVEFNGESLLVHGLITDELVERFQLKS